MAHFDLIPAARDSGVEIFFHFYRGSAPHDVSRLLVRPQPPTLALLLKSSPSVALCLTCRLGFVCFQQLPCCTTPVDIITSFTLHTWWKRDMNGRYYEEPGWSNLPSNAQQMLTPASLVLRSRCTQIPNLRDLPHLSPGSSSRKLAHPRPR